MVVVVVGCEVEADCTRLPFVKFFKSRESGKRLSKRNVITRDRSEMQTSPAVQLINAVECNS